ncbi:arginine-ornithine antiporter, partial [Staphylococcus aureus]|nr:arginine-ornithine antiporter [Staphylococcus aureus]
PYTLSAFYQVKYTIQNKSKANLKQWIIGIIASIYTIWLVYAAGLDYLLLTMLLYIPGLLVYSYVQRDNNKHLTKLDYTLFIFIIVLAIIGIVRLITGNISVF